MKFNKTVLIIVFAFVAIVSNAQNIDWVSAFTDNISPDIATGSIADEAGNLYTVGYFSGSVDFDPGINIFNLSASGTDLFISKLNTAGNLVWVKNLAYIGSNETNITIDNIGNIYITGSFSGDADFDPSSNTYNLSSVAIAAFMLKLDVNGNFVWVKKIGGTNYNHTAYISAAKIDNLGNIYTTGSFSKTGDFDPGANTFNLTATGDSTDVFMTKFDSTGNFLWAKKVGGLKKDKPYAIDLDVLGNIYIAGYFMQTTDFDPNISTYILTPISNRDMFVLKLDNTGSFIWVKQTSALVSSMKVDDWGNVYTIGAFQGTVDFDPGATTFNLTSNVNAQLYGGTDVFITKLDALGNFVWAKQIEGLTENASAYASAIVIDNGGDIYITGNAIGLFDFDPSVNTIFFNSSNADLFALKIDNAGNLIWATELHSTQVVASTSISLDNDNNIYIAGGYLGVLEYVPVPAIPAASFDIFNTKITQCGLPIPPVFYNGNSLSTNMVYDSYQWIDAINNQPISGATSSIFSPNSNGIYQLVVSKNSCYISSSCYEIGTVGTTENVSIKAISAYPNPASDLVTIDLGIEYAIAEINIFSLIGQLMTTEKHTDSQLLQVEMPHDKGIYFVNISLSNGERKSIRIIKE